MLAAEKSVRDLVNRDLDCTDLSFRLMAMRTDLAALIRRWREAGGGDELTAVAEGLKQGARPESRGKRVSTRLTLVSRDRLGTY